MWKLLESHWKKNGFFEKAIHTNGRTSKWGEARKQTRTTNGKLWKLWEYQQNEEYEPGTFIAFNEPNGSNGLASQLEWKSGL